MAHFWNEHPCSNLVLLEERKWRIFNTLHNIIQQIAHY